jgi:glycosyltransferase involved in cell wall biosynthesis
MAIYVDHTHLGRHVTGLERITLELFSRAALAPLEIVPITAQGTRQMVAKQTFGLPMRLAASSSILLCPGFPPSPLLRPFASRVLPYIHDIFLLSRPADLNRRARIYMAAPFKLALHHYPRFLVNSRDTGRKLAAHCRRDATITLYRPPVRNVFDLDSVSRTERDPRSLRLVALGTVEPRKNFVAAARIIGALRARGFPSATLDIVGRRGWGEDWRMLEALPGVTLHGYQPIGRVQQLIEDADVFICTSHDEGLGLPLLEAQYGGLPVVAPDAAIFHEVLGVSGIFIDPSEPVAAAAQIEAVLSGQQWRSRYVALATQNLERWNALAAADRDSVISLIAGLAERRGSAAPVRHSRTLDRGDEAFDR